jgi:hypothetical protein
MLDTTRDQIDRQNVSDAEGPLHRALGLLNGLLLAIAGLGQPATSDANNMDALNVLAYGARDAVEEAYRHVGTGRRA